MSTLELKELSHPAGEVIKIAAGKTLDLKSQGSVTMPTGSVLQVVHTDYTTAYAKSVSTSVADVAGFSAVITPASTASKILVMVSVAFGYGVDTYPYVLLTRNGTQVGNGVGATGNQINTFMSATATGNATSIYNRDQAFKQFLDTPSSTSSLTYQIQFCSPYQRIGYINRQEADSDSTWKQFPTSTITLMEIQG